MLQTYAYWLMGAIANSPAVLARYAGYYKGVQSLGAAISWILDASGMMFRWQVRPVLTLAAQRVRYSMQCCKESSKRLFLKCPQLEPKTDSFAIHQQGIICFALATIMIPPTYIVASWITETSEDAGAESQVGLGGSSQSNMDVSK
jgi:hypothetical protein